MTAYEPIHDDTPDEEAFCAEQEREGETTLSASSPLTERERTLLEKWSLRCALESLRVRP